MGIYTNASYNNYTSSNYTSVKPFKGDHFNYHELGIIAAAESAANRNAFMKAIAIQELASVEQYGNTDVLYESVDFKSIFEKVRAFFKKIIEKIQKIFHTFIARMSAWFGNSKDFAKKYEKEVIKNWSKVSNDWEFKGYNFTNILKTKPDALGKRESVKQAIEEVCDANSEVNKAILAAVTDVNFTNVMKYLMKQTENKNGDITGMNEAIKAIRDKKEDFEDLIRGKTIGFFNTDNIKGMGDNTKLDSKDFTENLYKLFRNGEDTKEDLKKSDVVTSYGGSINSMMTFLKDYDKIKSTLEKSEKDVEKGIDDIIKDLDKAENDLVKENRSNADKQDVTIKINECIVQISSLCQAALGFAKECATQAFSAELSATKDACSQAKEICVKVIGLNKKMTESYDYSERYNNNSFDGDFISSVKLV